MKCIGRISGIVTYADGSKGQFAAHIDDKGIVSTNVPTDSKQSLVEVLSDENWLESMLTMLSDTLAISPVGTPSKEVTGMIAEFSGRIARDNGTWADFCVQYTPKTGPIAI